MAALTSNTHLTRYLNIKAITRFYKLMECAIWSTGAGLPTKEAVRKSPLIKPFNVCVDLHAVSGARQG